ncbi:cysteine proteinase inhibitor 1-like [Solanum dulcamara]|uniref:cysteine proteinase inhibitor 1-like n=1 Tax=Solanum dulcamara TaxID=45834 RepID=UPI0024850684|nr:cysteine proteinase inhibitor 1-like [Solanum dulcamara]
MALKFNCFLAGTLFSAVMISSLFLHISAALGGGGKGGLLGGWRPITDTNDVQVVEIGKFAVDQHNKESKSKLVFKRVVKGETQVVAGTNYRLVISTTDGSRRSRSGYKYLAEVWDKPWENFRNLTSFKKL